MAAATGAASTATPNDNKNRPQMLMFDYYLIFIHFFGYSINSNDFSESPVKKDSRWRFVKFISEQASRNRYNSGKGRGTGIDDNDSTENFERTLSFANKVLTSTLTKNGQRKVQADRRRNKNLHNIDNLFASVHEKVRRDRAINNQNSDDKGHRPLAGSNERQEPLSGEAKQRQTFIGRFKYRLLDKLLIGLKFYAIILTTFLTANHCIVLVDYVMLSSKILTELLLELRLVITKFSALVFVLAWHSNRTQVRQLIQLVKSTSLRINCRNSLCPGPEDTVKGEESKETNSLDSNNDNSGESNARHYCKQVDKKVCYWWLMCVCVSVIHFSLSEAEIRTAHHLWTWLDDYSLHQLSNKTISKPTLYAMATFDNYIYTIHVYGTRLIGASIICIVCSLQTDSIKSLNYNATKLLRKIDPGRDNDDGKIHHQNSLSDRGKFFILGESNWIKVSEHARVAPSEGYLSVPLDRIAECSSKVVSASWSKISRLLPWLVSCGKHTKYVLCCVRCYLFNHNRRTPGFSSDTQRRRPKQQSPLWHKYDAATAAASSADKGIRQQAAFRDARESPRRLSRCCCCRWWQLSCAPPTRWLLRRQQQLQRRRIMLQQRRLKSSVVVVNGCRRCLRELQQQRRQQQGNGGQGLLWPTPDELVVGRVRRLPRLKDDDSSGRYENIVVWGKNEQNGRNLTALAAAAIRRSNYDLWALGCWPRPTTFVRSSSRWNSGIDRLHRYLILRNCFSTSNGVSPSFLFEQYVNGAPELLKNGSSQGRQEGPRKYPSPTITATGESDHENRTIITSELVEDNLGILARDYELVRSSNQKIDSCFGHMLLIQFSFLFLMSCIDVVYFSIEFNPNTHKTKYIIVSGMILLWWPYFLLYKLASDIETASKELMITVRRLARLSLIASYNQIEQRETTKLDYGPGGDWCRCLNKDNDTTKAKVMMMDDSLVAPAAACTAALEGDEASDQQAGVGPIVSGTSESSFLEKKPNRCDDRSSSTNTARHLPCEARVNERGDSRSFFGRGRHKSSKLGSLRVKRSTVWPSKQGQEEGSSADGTGNNDSNNNNIDGYHEASTLNLFNGMSQRSRAKAQQHLVQSEPNDCSTVSSQQRQPDLAHLLCSPAMSRRRQVFGSSQRYDHNDKTFDERHKERNSGKDAYFEHPMNQSQDRVEDNNDDYSSNHQILNQLDHLFVPIHLSIFGVMAVNKLFLLNFAKIVITSSVMIIQFISS